MDVEQQLNSDTIAQNLRYLMKSKTITETKVAQELNIPVMTLRRLLSGETTDPRVFTLKNIADYFNVSIDSLIGESAKPTFIPLFDWKSIKNLIHTDLQNWQEWIPVTIGKNTHFSKNCFALESRPSMHPRFLPGTIFILDPALIPVDGDLVLVNLLKNNELTLRKLFIDPPEWQLHPISQDASILQFTKKDHDIMAVVSLTLFYNRKLNLQE